MIDKRELNRVRSRVVRFTPEGKARLKGHAQELNIPMCDLVDTLLDSYEIYLKTSKEI